MRTLDCCLAILGLAMVLGCVPSGEVKEVGKKEAARWLRWVIPLPREATIEKKAIVPAAKVVLVLRTVATPAELCAADEMAALFKEKTGMPIQVAFDEYGGEGFQIVLGVCDADGRLSGRPMPGAEGLAKLPHAEQAYRIVPIEDHALALLSSDPRGAYYAAKTLQQLLLPAFSKDRGGKAMVAVPLARVADWPDLAERGLWGGSANEDIEWMAERKMNLVETHVKLTINEQGRGVAEIPAELIQRAQRHAVNLVPIITHLEQLPSAVFTKFPQLKAVGDEEAWKKVGSVTPVCFSQPKAQEILSDWFSCLAQYPEVSDVNVWLSENEVPCLCEKCKAVNPFVLQTRLILRAWEAAKRVRHDLRLRILLTQGSYKSNDKVLATVPREVGITYYDGGRTYDSSRDPMIYPLLEEYAAKGGWLGCYPQLTASWRIVCPWSGPQFIKARMKEFAAKKLKCLCGYATPSNRFYQFNVTAAAEWSWNVGGRSEREFAAAWATREGLSDPEKAADWAMTLGPVGWDVYGARIPYSWVHGSIGWMFKGGKPPALGAKSFAYFPDKEHFDRDLAACDRAMKLAQGIRAPALIEETRVIRGFVQMLKGMYLLAEATAQGKKMSASDRGRADAALALMDEGTRAAHDGLLAWGQAVAPELMAKPPGRFTDTVSCVEEALTQASDIAVGLGVKDPGRPYRPHKIGGWTTDDFKTGRSQKKTWEVTSFVSDAGRYSVSFYYDKGWYGASIKRVALVSTPADDPKRQTEVACDAHQGSTGHSPKNTVYELRLKDYDPKRKYFVVADLDGVPPNSPPEKQGCEGHVVMRKARE